MSAVVAFVFIMLHFEAGVSVVEVYLYHRVGDSATLPCKGARPYSPPTMVSWLYNADTSQTSYEVQNGNFFRPSPKESRVNLSMNLSLVINNIYAEDAGRYSCRTGVSPYTDTLVYLSVLTISPRSPEADPNRENTATVECSLLRKFDIPPHAENSLRWLDETGTVLDQYECWTKCSSVLTVTPQRDRSRTYTCQFVQKQAVKIQARHTLVMGSTDLSPLNYVMFTLRITALILMIRVTVAVNRKRVSEQLLNNIRVGNYDKDEDDDSTVSYENV